MLEAHGYKVDPEAGHVFGKRGLPIKKKTTAGYIQVWGGGVQRMAHRLIWEAANGPIPDGMETPPES